MPDRACAEKPHELIKAYVVNLRGKLGLSLATKECASRLKAGVSNDTPE